MVKPDLKNIDLVGLFSTFAFLMLAFTFAIPNLYNVGFGAIITAGVVALVAQIIKKDFCLRHTPSVLFVLLAMAALPFLHWLIFGSEGSWARMTHKCFGIGLPMWFMPLAAIPLRRYCPSEKTLFRAVLLGVVCYLCILLVTYLCSLVTEFDGLDYSAFNLRMCFESMFNMFPHRTYFSVILLFGLIAQWRISQLENTSKQVLILLALSVLFGVVIFFSGARVALVSYFMLLLVMFVERGVAFGLAKTKIIMVIGVLLLLVVLVLSQHSRVQSAFFALLNGQNEWSTLDPRFQIWSSVLSLTNEMPFWGYGCDMFQEPLCAQFAADGFEQGVNEQYSAHNQFFVSFLNYSWVGVVLLCLFFVTLWKSNNKLFSRTWVILLLLNFFFEHMLERSSGVMTVVSSTVFLSLLPLNKDGREPDKEESLLFKVMAPLFIATVLFLAFYYVHKDKARYFGSFRRYLTEVTDLPNGYPDELKGATCKRIDASTSTDVYGDKAYTFVRFQQISSEKTDSLYYSIWMYVSPDFEGTKAYIALEGNRAECASAMYDLNHKGQWQWLETRTGNLTGNVDCSLLVERDAARSFDGMHGYLLFSSPKIDLRK